MPRRSTNEPLGMTLVSGIENDLPFGDKLSGLAVVDGCRCHQAQAGMAVLVVVPGKEALAETARILNRSKAVRVSRAVLQSFEVRLREGIVVRDVRTAMRFHDSQIGKQQGQRFGRHRRSPVRVNGELAGQDLLRFTGVFDKLPGQAGRFAISDHPARNVAAKHVEHDVKGIEAPFHRPAKLGDVPAPELVRSPAVPVSCKEDG